MIERADGERSREARVQSHEQRSRGKHRRRHHENEDLYRYKHNHRHKEDDEGLRRRYGSRNRRRGEEVFERREQSKIQKGKQDAEGRGPVAEGQLGMSEQHMMTRAVRAIGTIDEAQASNVRARSLPRVRRRWDLAPPIPDIGETVHVDRGTLPNAQIPSRHHHRRHHLTHDLDVIVIPRRTEIEQTLHPHLSQHHLITHHPTSVQTASLLLVSFHAR